VKYSRATVVIFVLFITFFLISFGGCGYRKEFRELRSAKRVLSKEKKQVEEIEKIRGQLRRIIDMKIRAVELLESADRILGRKYMEIGSYALARDVLKEAEQLKPRNPFIKKDLGECYYLLGTSEVNKEKQAEYFSISKKYLMKALEINPDFIEAHYALGLLLLFGYKDNERALNEMKKVLSYDPNHIEAHFALGRIYYEMGELGKALNEYITLLRILPKDSYRRKKVEDNIMRINQERGIHQ